MLSCSSLLTRLSTHQEARAAPERDHLLWWLDSAETEQPLLAWYGAPAAGAGVLHTVLAGDVNAACSGGVGGTWAGDRRSHCHWSLGHVTAVLVH